MRITSKQVNYNKNTKLKVKKSKLILSKNISEKIYI